MMIMHKMFYASGFLYHPSSQQILLQQKKSSSSSIPLWVLLEDSFDDQAPIESSFRQLVLTLIGQKIKNIYPVYSYFNEKKDMQHHIIYATCKKLQDFPPKNGYSFRWFSFKEVTKLPITDQTKHDIVVSQRVIDAHERKSLGMHTL